MFEFDTTKSAVNKLKHGINFVEAQILWTGITVQIAAPSATEPRFAVIGMIGAKHWTAFATMRGKNIRIISVRRARPKEIESYEKSKKEING